MYVSVHHINVIEHSYPYETIRCMKHSALTLLQEFGSSQNIKFGKALIAEGKSGHQAFDIIVTRASKRFTMSGTVKMMRLPTIFQRMFANAQKIIQLCIICHGRAIFGNGIMGGNKSNDHAGQRGGSLGNKRARYQSRLAKSEPVNRKNKKMVFYARPCRRSEKE